MECESRGSWIDSLGESLCFKVQQPKHKDKPMRRNCPNAKALVGLLMITNCQGRWSKVHVTFCCVSHAGVKVQNLINKSTFS